MRRKRKKWEQTRRISALVILLFCICVAFVTQFAKASTRTTQRSSGFAAYAGVQLQQSLYETIWNYYLPIIGAQTEEPRSLAELLSETVQSCFPVYAYAAQPQGYAAEGADSSMDETVASEMEVETEFEAEFEAELEQQLAKQLREENEMWNEKEQLSGAEAAVSDEMTMGDALQGSFLHEMQGTDLAGSKEKSLFSYATKKAQQIDFEELKDYETLVKKHYCIDGTTSSNGEQLNVEKLRKKDMSLKGTNEKPQILIYHTHSLEGYSDSKSGDLSESVVGLGDYLTELLEERYGYCVLHDRGTYDSDRDRAYGVAGPALEALLKKYPSIEVVIDLHRDGVPEDVYLLTEVNDTRMAPIMFFNGLSYTKKNGKLSALENPNLAENLAFSLQMELMASAYYPELSRGIYLKGLRYNLHYCPKSLLVEVGAQTNTLQEAMNAMPPLAEALKRDLSGEKP